MLCRCGWEDQLREPFNGGLACDEATFRAFGVTGRGQRRWRGTGKAIMFGMFRPDGHVGAMPIAEHSQPEVMRDSQAPLTKARCTAPTSRRPI